MTTRRSFLHQSLGGSSLLAMGSIVPEFLARTATAADESKAKETILVVIEMTGGNDGLNTVIPYGDDLYHKARPTLGFRKNRVIPLDDHHGLHHYMHEIKKLYDRKDLAIVQGVGYPNPDRSHFESMDIWQLADPKRSQKSGWLARSIPGMPANEGVPGMFLGEDRLPIAMQGTDGGVISLKDRESFKLQLTGPSTTQKPRKSLLEDLNAETGPAADLAAFVRKRQLQTYTSLQRIEDALKEAKSKDNDRRQISERSLTGKLDLISRLIRKNLGTRIYYVTHEGFDTHSKQEEEHAPLLGELSGGISHLFETLKGSKDDTRVIAMTYSEFGRRVRENGSRGTDHGAASCMFLAGPRVQGGIVGKHPKLDDLTDGDLRFHTDFRRVYATLLDHWLNVDSQLVLGAKFEPLPLIEPKA